MFYRGLKYIIRYNYIGTIKVYSKAIGFEIFRESVKGVWYPLERRYTLRFILIIVVLMVLAVPLY